MTLALNLATRGRPPLLLSTIQRTLPNIARPDTVFMVSCDEDDAPTVEMLRRLDATGAFGGRVLLSIEPREDSVAAKWNRVLTAAPEASVYWALCDDAPVITPGFDQIVLDAAKAWPDGIGVVFNHLENLSFTSMQAVTRRFAELMGGIYPELFPYWFIDHWLSDIAEMIDRIAFADVRLDCASDRPATMERREASWWATFYDALHLRRRRIAMAIIDSAEFVTPEWEKAILRRRYPLVEGYSTMVNDTVRAAQLSGPPPDARYLRIKAAAIALLKAEILPELAGDAGSTSHAA